ncbi:MAG: glutathione S-transferase N-terminal domain-containing protein [Pseudomonadales bacterium]|nr:glutathione S-transferase N-terminal domain-containing protein [Pseudomonadales bacterium]
MFLRLIRQCLGRVVVFVNWLTRPAQIERTDAERKALALVTRGMALYEYYGCPFCVKTRRQIYRLNLDIERRDIRRRQVHRDNLLAGGGQLMVPCLRIEENGKVQWLYESNDIIDYINRRFGSTAEAARA